MRNSLMLLGYTVSILMIACPGSAFTQTLAESNDLTGSLGVMDPSTVAKCDNSYYTYGTHGGGNLTSKNRKEWSSNGKAATSSQSWWSPYGTMMWAPDVSVFKSKYYCYYSVAGSNKNCAVGLTTNATLDPSSPNYKWADQGIVVDSAYANNGSFVNAIDPSTFIDDDGKWYLLFGSFQNGIRMGQLNPTSGKLLMDTPHPTKITNHAGEAASLIRWKNYYYCAISQGKCCANMTSTYYITYGRATNVNGPYTNKTGGSMLTSSVEKLLKGSNDSTAKNGVVAVGVGGFFYDGANGLDTLFMDYMGYTAPSGSPLLYIKPLYADASGWLTFDATNSTIMTRPTPSVSVHERTSRVLEGSCKNEVSVRLISDVNNRFGRTTGVLYSITGQRVYTKHFGHLAPGIYMEEHLWAK